MLRDYSFHSTCLRTIRVSHIFDPKSYARFTTLPSTTCHYFGIHRLCVASTSRPSSPHRPRTSVGFPRLLCRIGICRHQKARNLSADSFTDKRPPFVDILIFSVCFHVGSMRLLHLPQKPASCRRPPTTLSCNALDRQFPASSPPPIDTGRQPVAINSVEQRTRYRLPHIFWFCFVFMQDPCVSSAFLESRHHPAGHPSPSRAAHFDWFAAPSPSSVDIGRLVAVEEPKSVAGFVHQQAHQRQQQPPQRRRRVGRELRFRWRPTPPGRRWEGPGGEKSVWSWK